MVGCLDTAEQRGRRIEIQSTLALQGCGEQRQMFFFFEASFEPVLLPESFEQLTECFWRRFRRRSQETESAEAENQHADQSVPHPAEAEPARSP